MKKKIGIYEAKTHLSKILRAVKNNKITFEITERGKPLALLSPVEETQDEVSLEQRIQDLEFQGVISLPSSDAIPEVIEYKKGALKRFLEDRE